MAALNEAPIEGEPSHGGYVTLGGAVGEIDATDLPPFGDDVAVTEHNPGRAAAMLEPSQPRRPLTRVLTHVLLRQVDRPIDLVVDGELHSDAQPLRIHPELLRGAAFPVLTRRREIGGICSHLRSSLSHRQSNQSRGSTPAAASVPHLTGPRYTCTCRIPAPRLH